MNGIVFAKAEAKSKVVTEQEKMDQEKDRNREGRRETRSID